MNDYFSVAYGILDEIYRGDAFSQIKLNEALSAGDDRNAALITKIVYGVLENDLYLEYVLDQVVTKRPKPSVWIALKIGAYLIKFMDSVPDYAAVNNAVNFIKQAGKGALAGFVNATLKRVAATEAELPKDTVDRLSIQYSYPKWFITCCIEQYGESLAERILAYRGTGETSVRVNASAITPARFEELLRKQGCAYRKAKVKGTYYVSHSTMQNAKISPHLYTNQGVSSVLVCRAMAVRDYSKILDVCAAPGGKSVLLAETAPNGRVVAWDIHAHRVALIRKYAARMGAGNIRCEVKDASVSHAEYEEKFDYVLCDVPCSGFGVAADKPDIKLKRTFSDVLTLAETQAKILRACSRYVKPGGTLLYSTCTIVRQENQDIVDAFLAESTDFTSERVELEIEPGYRIGNYVQLLPCLDEVQGFFLAKLRRRPS